MMFPLLSAVLAFVVSLFRSRVSLHRAHLALRHQHAVYQQTVRRPRLQPIDRLFWVCLSRLWTGWWGALAFVQPRTIIAWQQKRFRDPWRRLSQRGTSGHPRIARKGRELMRHLWQAHPTGGRHGLLASCASGVPPQLTVVPVPPLPKALESLGGTPTALGWGPTRGRHVIRQQVWHTPTMICDPGGHGRSLQHAASAGPTHGKAEARMRCTEVGDTPNQIHAVLQRQCAACQRPAPARQRSEAFPKRRVQPFNVGRIDHALSWRAAPQGRPRVPC
jgi:hypothetical protein